MPQSRFIFNVFAKFNLAAREVELIVKSLFHEWRNQNSLFRNHRNA